MSLPSGQIMRNIILFELFSQKLFEICITIDVHNLPNIIFKSLQNFLFFYFIWFIFNWSKSIYSFCKRQSSCLRLSPFNKCSCWSFYASNARRNLLWVVYTCTKKSSKPLSCSLLVIEVDNLFKDCVFIIL